LLKVKVNNVAGHVRLLRVQKPVAVLCLQLFACASLLKGLNVGSATVKVNALLAAFVLTVSICMSQVFVG